MEITAPAVAADVLAMALGVSGLLLLILCAGSDCWRVPLDSHFVLLLQTNTATYLNQHPEFLMSFGRGVVTGDRIWKATKMQDAKDPLSSVGLSVRCRGLWSECIFDNVANFWTCDIPISYLSEHPAALVGTRVLVILSGFLTLAALPLFIAGMKCTNLIRDKVPRKYKFSLAAGSLFLLGGLAGAIAVLWYGIDTVQKYKLEVTLGIPGVTYELGYAYWMAAGGTACACSAGTLLIVAGYLSAQSPGKDPSPRRCPPDSKGTYL